ncbi:MAG: hypothetical protein ACREJQ_03795, partial [bacterium]
MSADAEAHLIALSGGDARRLLNVLETAVSAKTGGHPSPTPPPQRGEEKGGAPSQLREGIRGKGIIITLADIESVSQTAKIRYDRLG